MDQVVLFLLFGSLAFAKVDPVCTELSRLTCAPGLYNDGTGEVRTNVFESPFGQNLLKELREVAQAEVRSILQDPDESRFHKIALSATGLALHSDCQDVAEGAALSDSCKKFSPRL